MSSTPIADHALLSDCHSSALVDRSGSVEWLTLPRFDSPSVMARLLDVDAGHWAIRPVDRFTSTRRYLDETMVLETTFHAETGTAVLTDALATGPGNRGHDLGTDAPHLLVRTLTCVSGQLDIEVSYAPRPEYGLVMPLMGVVDGGVTARGGPCHLMLSTPVRLTWPDHADANVAASTATGRARLAAGETLRFALHASSQEHRGERVWTPAELEDVLEDTISAWRSWSALHRSYRGASRDLVRSSGRVLQALTFQPTGAVVAAPTTSLPEEVGGERNWDYRYAWVRDASMSLEALWVAACPHEAHHFFEFMANAGAARVGQELNLQIMFGVGGEHDLSERTLPHLAGWRDSRPVRIGNGAWRQRQVDVYGELLGAACTLTDVLVDLDEPTSRFLATLAEAAAAHWSEPDQGIWEVRGEPRHFLHSKVMCWVALDRAIALADRIGAGHRIPEWIETREEISRYVLQEGWSDTANAFTQHVGTDALDASSLMLPIVGFLPASDPRVLATMDAIDAGLTDDRGLVYRYLTRAGVDGLAGDEGTFLLCTFWLAQALAMADRLERAREVFDRAARFVNDVGLLAEEVDPASGDLLGNFPQAFSHIGLVNAAWAITQAEERAAR